MNNGALNGIYKEYFETGDVKLVHHFENGKKIDSSISFYPDSNNIVKVKKKWDEQEDYYLSEYYSNGYIKFEGFVKDSVRIGTWNFYKNNGFIDKRKEYMNVHGGSYLNQVYNLNNNGDTLYNGSSFISIRTVKDTIVLNEPFQATAFVEVEFFKTKDSYIKVVVANVKENFTHDFSNEEEIKLDVFNNLSLDTTNQKWFPGVNKRHTAVFGKKFNSPGDKMVRGYVIEIFDQEPTETDSIIKRERNIYFDLRVFVKDSLSGTKK